MTSAFSKKKNHDSQSPMVYHYRDGHNVILDIDNDLFTTHTENIREDSDVLFKMVKRYPDDRKYFDVWESFLFDEINYVHGLSFSQFIFFGNIFFGKKGGL